MTDVPTTVTARPQRARVICWIAAPVVLLVFAFIATGLHGKTGDGPGTFQRGDQVAMIGLGVLAALGVLMFTRPRVVADANSIRVRNVFGSYEVEWTIVRAVTFGRGAPWLTLQLFDDDVLTVMAVQAADKQYAVQAARSLRALHSAAHEKAAHEKAADHKPGAQRKDGVTSP